MRYTTHLPNDEFIPMIPDIRPQVTVSILGETQDYNHDLMNIPGVWRTTCGEGVKVAILDTGLPKHNDIRPCGNASFIRDYQHDTQGHGTMTGGIIAAVANNGMGVKGIAPDCEDWYGAVLGPDGTGSVRSIIEGLYWAADVVKADVVNMSLGIPGDYKPDAELEKACEYAFSHGCTLVAAAGNDGGKVNYPARFDEVIAVGAVDKYMDRAPFSSHGPEVDFVAGGVDIYSTYRNNGYAKMSGTSFASPAIAGVAALIISKFKAQGRTLTPSEVKEKIGKIAFDLGPHGHDEFTGYGIPIFTKSGDMEAAGKPKEPGLWERIARWIDRHIQ